jgi:hypothetical protein
LTQWARLTADRVGAIGSGGSSVGTLDFALSAGVINQFNAYLKPSTSNFCALFASDFSTVSAVQYFNVNTGAKLTSSGAGDLVFDCASIAPEVDGWKFARLQFKSTRGRNLQGWHRRRSRRRLLYRNRDGRNPSLAPRRTSPNHLMTFGRDFTNAVWTKTGASIVANTATGYDGAVVADTLKEDTSNGTHSVMQTFTKAASALPYKFFAKIKPLGTGAFRRAVMVLRSGASNGVYAVYDLSTGNVDVPVGPFGTGFTGITSAITSAAGGWKNLMIQGTSDTTTTIGCELQLDGGTSADPFTTNAYTGDGASGLFIDDARLFQIA